MISKYFSHFINSVNKVQTEFLVTNTQHLTVLRVLYNVCIYGNVKMVAREMVADEWLIFLAAVRVAVFK